MSGDIYFRIGMITEKQYKSALIIVKEYIEQSKLSRNSFDVYEFFKSVIFPNSDVTLEEFDEILQLWVSIQNKKLNITEYGKEKANRKPTF